MDTIFSVFARETARYTGSARAFIIAGALVLVWAATGPVFHFSDTWQLVMNTASSIVTFLMVFLIQNAQNRDTSAIQLKLDELIQAIEGARNNLRGIEELSESELADLRQHLGKTGGAH